MKEVKKPQKSIVSFYALAFLLIILFNALVLPLITRGQVKTVTYDQFMSMTEDRDIGQVEIEYNQIIFTNKAGDKVFRTGLVDDPGRTERKVVALVKAQYEKAKAIISENKAKLDQLAQYLYANETITGEEFMAILNS